MWGTKSSQGCRRRVCATDSAASAFAPRRRAGAAAAGRGGGRIITIRVGGGMGLVPLRLLLAVAAAAASIDDWAGRLAQPTCLEIPANLTLCRGIGYTRMRLPNLLEHDSMAEVQQQARSWVQLVNRRCHPDTQLFLCSLFSPVCLERPIFPCRSLCEAVRLGCEATMAHYGYPWPDMVRCDKFPLDNDMCIGVQSAAAGHSEDSASAACRACQQANTTESLVDNYCRADFGGYPPGCRSLPSHFRVRPACTRDLNPRPNPRAYCRAQCYQNTLAVPLGDVILEVSRI